MTTQSAATPKTPRNTRRKSVSHSSKKNKRQSVIIPTQENSDVLNNVLNVFEEKIKKTKEVKIYEEKLFF